MMFASLIGKTRRIPAYVGAAAAAVVLLSAGCSKDDNPRDDNNIPLCTDGIIGVCGDHGTTDPEFTVIESTQWGLIKNTGTNGCSEATGKSNVAKIQRALDSLSTAGVKDIKLENGEYCLWGANGYENSLSYNPTTVKIPSNINFDLGGSTLRLVPNKTEKSDVLVMEDVQNIKLFNGRIIGDRQGHDYTATQGAGTHEWGVGINILGGRNIELYNLEVSEVTGDNIGITGAANNGSKGSKNITIRNCKISKARRGGIVIVEADTVNIYANEIFDIYDDIRNTYHNVAAIGAEAAITFEGYGYYNSDLSSLIKNVQIYNNKLIGSNKTSSGRATFLNTHSGSNTITIRDNELIGSFEMRFGYNILFKNNRISGGFFYTEGTVNNNPEKPWANGGNLIVEDNEFHDGYMILSSHGTLDQWHTHFKQNFAFIRNKFYRNKSTSNIANLTPCTNMAWIDNEIIVDTVVIGGIYTELHEIYAPKAGEPAHIAYFVGNTIPKSYSSREGIGFWIPRSYCLNPSVSSCYQLCADDIMGNPPYCFNPPPINWIPDWYNESNDRAAAEAWVNSWRTMY